MLDINLIRTDAEKVKRALLKRMGTVDLDPILTLDRRRRGIIAERDALKMRQNAFSAGIASTEKDAKQAMLAEMKEAGEVTCKGRGP
ncbi:MAG TPA: hypothetical protein PL037_08160, partial [Elusimicrobiales bacterium]|nr:hypothetical protein [Elusimicrobiales bacterium]